MKFIAINSIVVFAVLLLQTGLGFGQEGGGLMPYLKRDKFGYANSKGDVIIEPKYDYALPFQNGYALVRLDYKWGLIKENGQVILEPIARQVSMFDSNGLSVVRVENMSGVINTNGTLVVPLKYSNVNVRPNFIQVTNSNNQSALLDLSGKIIVDFNYRSFRFPEPPFESSNLIVTEIDQKYGLIELKEKGKFQELIPPQYEYLNILNNKLLEAKKNGKWGLVNSKNEKILPFEFDDFKKEGLLIVSEQEIEFQIKIKLFEPESYVPLRRIDDIVKEYDNETRTVYYFMTQVEQDQIKAMGFDLSENPLIRTQYSLINEQGQIVIPAQFAEFTVNNYFVHVKTEEGITLFDKNGKQVSTQLFAEVGEMNEGLVLVKVGSMENIPDNFHELSERDKTIAAYNRFKYGFMDSTGTMVIPLRFNGAFEFKQNRAPIRFVDKWGLIDKQGTLITADAYDQLYYAGENRFGFRIGERWGLLDLNGREIVPAKYYEYREASYDTDWFGGYSGLVFENGKAKTTKKLPGFNFSSTTLINTNGDQLFPFKYITIEEQVGGLFKVSVRNHDNDRESYGLVDKDGSVLVPVYQDNIWWLEEEEVFVVAKQGYKQNYRYYNQNGQEVASPYKAIEREGLREYKRLSNGYYSAKYNQYTVYFTPDGIPLFEE